MGKKQLAFAPCPSIDEINSIEGIIDCQISSDEEDELLTNVSISGVRELEIIYQCINCNKPIQQSTDIVTCETCSTTQRVSSSITKTSAKLIIVSQTGKMTLRASGAILKNITETETETITPESILLANNFNCTVNKFNTITSVSRN